MALCQQYEQILSKLNYEGQYIYNLDGIVEATHEVGKRKKEAMKKDHGVER